MRPLENFPARRNLQLLDGRPISVVAPCRRCQRIGFAASNDRARQGSYTQMVAVTALRWTLVATQRRMRIRVLALLALGCFPSFGALDQYVGKTIASIQFDPPKQPLTRDQTLALFAIKEGQPLQAG